MAVTPDSTRAVTAGEDATARVWDLATGTETHTLARHTDSVDGRTAGRGDLRRRRVERERVPPRGPLSAATTRIGPAGRATTGPVTRGGMCVDTAALRVFARDGPLLQASG